MTASNRAFTQEHSWYRLKDNHDVLPKRPIGDIPDVKFNALRVRRAYSDGSQPSIPTEASR